MSARRRRRLPVEPVTLAITDLAHDGRGVGRHEDKATFVHGGLPGEVVRARLIARNRRFDEAVCIAVEQPGTDRVEPRCRWFDDCGGCALQHLDHAAQVRFKHKRLEDNLVRIGGVRPESWQTPITAEPWFYRRRSRLSVRLVQGKGRVLVGFRERGGRFVADVADCAILHPDLADRLMDLSRLIGALSVADAVPQIETASGDHGSAIIIRHLRELTEQDLELLRDFSAELGLAVYLQPKGPETIWRLAPEQHQLSYELPEFGLKLAFHPTQFVQVNAAVNRQLVSRAIELLALEASDRALDLFCGLGNFTLPLATRAGVVTGIEGDASLIASATANAEDNGLKNVQFEVADLAREPDLQDWFSPPYDKVLIDPPRSGALEILPLIIASRARRVVYVSCNPATLARDAEVLVNQGSYRLLSAGIADMFPHSAHVESIALFEREAAAR